MVEEHTWLNALDKQVTKTLRIALDAHGDRSEPSTGELLFAQSIRVMYKLKDPFEKMIALLYASDLPTNTMYDLCIPSKVIDGVNALNLRPSESYQQYLKRIKSVALYNNVLSAILKTKIENYMLDKTFSFGYNLGDAQNALKYLNDD